MTITTRRFTPPYLPTKENYTQTHPGLFKIDFAEEGEFNSCLRTEKSYKAGQEICSIANVLPGVKAYSTVQVLPDPPLSSSQDPNQIRHIELNSDLLYVNHSCDPNVAFEVPSNKSEWKVRALKDLKKGEIMTFAYFSTEWDMEQPFKCECSSSKCLGVIDGAKNIPANVLEKFFINDHIKALKASQLITPSVPGKVAPVSKPLVHGSVQV